MDPQLIQLHFAQLSKIWTRSKNNFYSDPQRKEYHSNLNLLYQELLKEDWKKLSSNEIAEKKKVIDFFFKSINFLDDSTTSNIPFEIVKCLEIAQNQWIPNTKGFIIVTSLIKDVYGFSFDPSLVVNNNYYTIISKLYNIDFDKKLIQINVPKYLRNDYLAMVPLYHELGHFVDKFYNISNAFYSYITNQFFTGKLSGENLKTVLYYFPYINDPSINEHYINKIPHPIFLSHIAEYFCDLYASQYIENSLVNFLSYITEDSKDYSFSHPSTVSRNKIVEDFLADDKKNYVLNLIKFVIIKISGNELKKRFVNFNSTDLDKLIPLKITDENQLHYLFNWGWNKWMNYAQDFEKSESMNYKLTESKVLEIINNLIQKSISNYIIEKNWNKLK